MFRKLGLLAGNKSKFSETASPLGLLGWASCRMPISHEPKLWGRAYGDNSQAFDL